ncbi:MAG: DnaJ domain-containing protein [Gammaproteobacteria bacterium]
MFNAHEILGIEENASKQRIIQAYREKAALHHPDKGGSVEMMKLINQAHTELLQQVEESDFIETSSIDLDEILRKKIFEHIDTGEERISKHYKELHSSLVNQFKLEDIKPIPVYSCFKKFETDLYFDITLDNGEVQVIEYEDLFACIAQRNLTTEVEFKELEQLSKPLTPQTAVEIFIKFIEGQCFGNNLIKAKELITEGLNQLGKIHPVHNLYSGILEILNIGGITKGQEGKLLESLNKITAFVCNNTQQSMPYVAPLLQNKYFRKLFSQALHLFWQECSLGFKETDRLSLNNTRITKNYLSILAKQVLANVKDNIENDRLLRTTAFLKKLYEFEQFAMESAGEPHTADFYRERGFDTLNWLTVLIPFASREIIVNVLIQAGAYFQQASCSPQDEVSVKKADEKLALRAYREAIALSNDSAPDLEIYTHINCLKFISSFSYQDEDVTKLVDAIQTRALLLADLFPLYIKLQANIDFLRDKEQTLGIMRSFLHALVAIIEQNKSATNKVSIEHEHVNVMYQAYEACVKNWYQERYDPVLENKFRLELMQLLLENNNWRFTDLNEQLTEPVMIKRDADGWMQLIKPLRFVEHCMPSFASLEGIEFNNKTGEISFTLNKLTSYCLSDKKNAFTVYDLNEMLEKNITEAYFSLDPVDPTMMYHPFNAICFEPEDIYQTQFLNTMLLTDYILKFLTVGQEVQGIYPYNMRSIKEAIQHLPNNLQKIIDDFHKANQDSTGSIHRFWIEAEQITEATLDDGDVEKVAISDIKMVVKKHTMERDLHGNLVDIPKEHEGWDLYVLPLSQKSDLYEGRIIINGPAMVFVQDKYEVLFIEKHKVYKVKDLSIFNMEKQIELEKHPRDANGKVIVTINNSMFVYKLIKAMADLSKEPTYFSPEYIFAQEFTDHYDEFSKYILEFARLRELSKMTVAIKILNGKQQQTKRTINNLEKLLSALPSWEQKDSHASNHSDYFDIPNKRIKLDQDEVDFATFRYHNAEFIKSILPNNLYQQNLERLAKISKQIKKLIVTVDSADVDKICRDLYQENSVDITRKHGSHAWNQNSGKIWQQICNQKHDIAQKINAARIEQMQKQLYEAFSKRLKLLLPAELNRLINDTMRGYTNELAVELTKQDFIEEKEKLHQKITNLKKLLEGFKKLGLGAEEGKHTDLTKECLWVPASVRHHVADNSSRFVYGGVMVAPRVNSIDRTNQNFSRMMGNAFTGQNITTVNTAALSTARNFQNMAAANSNVSMRSQASNNFSRSGFSNQQATSTPARSFQTTSANTSMPARSQASSSSGATSSNAGRGSSYSQQSTSSSARAPATTYTSSGSVPVRSQAGSSSYGATSSNAGRGSSYSQQSTSSSARAPATTYTSSGSVQVRSQASSNSSSGSGGFTRSSGSNISSNGNSNSSGSGGNRGGFGGGRNTSSNSGGGAGGGNNSSGSSKYGNNSDFRDGLKLRTELAFKEAGLLDSSGKLTAKALECTKNADNRLKEGYDLKNKEVIAALTKNGQSIADWAKYSTNTATLGTGNKASIHFYYNEKTDEVMYEHDFKVKGGFAAATNTTQHKNCDEYVNTSKYGGDDVTLFTNAKTVRKTGQEPVSQLDPCHRYDGSQKLNR